MPDAPEDRAAAARRVALEIAGACRCMAPVMIRRCSPCLQADAITAALLAFHGGDAEPVGYTVRPSDEREGWDVFGPPGSAGGTEDARDEQEWVATFYSADALRAFLAAPVAGEAVALREALSQIAGHLNDTRPETHDEHQPNSCAEWMEQLAHTALAPGGRPRCETCGGSRKNPLGFPCPHCVDAPAAERSPDA